MDVLKEGKYASLKSFRVWTLEFTLLLLLEDHFLNEVLFSYLVYVVIFSFLVPLFAPLFLEMIPRNYYFTS